MTNLETRLRLVDAMGLGPLWVRRVARPRANERIEDPAGATDDAGSDAGSDRHRLIATMDWPTLQALVRGCLACPLSETRTHAVFGAGVERPAWLIVGGGPRASDDAAGVPFTGPAGRLLDAVLSSVGLSRDRDVFVTDVVKCRPPGDRGPSAREAATCRPYLDRQIALLSPGLIVAVGERAARVLVGPDATVDALRGRAHMLEVGGRAVPLVVTDDPTDLVADPLRKKRVWADLCVARALHRRTAALAS